MKVMDTLKVYLTEQTEADGCPHPEGFPAEQIQRMCDFAEWSVDSYVAVCQRNRALLCKIVHLVRHDFYHSCIVGNVCIVIHVPPSLLYISFLVGSILICQDCIS